MTTKMTTIDEAYIIGAKIAQFGQATVPADCYQREDLWNSLVAGWRENGLPSPSWKIVSTWHEEWEQNVSGESTAVVHGLTRDQIDILTLAKCDALHRKPTEQEWLQHCNLVQELSEFVNMPQLGIHAYRPGDWFCSPMRWNTTLWEETGCITLRYTFGRDI